MTRTGWLSLFLVIASLLGACAGKPANSTTIELGHSVFQHDFTGTSVPWTHTDFDNEEGKFTFALFSDLTGTDLRQVWDERYGNKYYHFIYRNVLFLVLDTEDSAPDFQRYIHKIRLEAIEVADTEGWDAFHATEYGQLEERKSGRVSAEQASYFQTVIEKYPKVCWTFILMHKPAWERPAEENFSSIEEALNGRPYTVFHGHVHAYLHEQRFGRDYIRLGTTGGSHTPGKPMAIDHVSLVTVSEDGVDIANLRMSGIFDKTGKVPLNGDEICLEGCSN